MEYPVGGRIKSDVCSHDELRDSALLGTPQARAVCHESVRIDSTVMLSNSSRLALERVGHDYLADGAVSSSGRMACRTATRVSR